MPPIADPIVSSTTLNDLCHAVARWDNEGGADGTGPREGDRIDGHSLPHALDLGTVGTVDAHASEDRLDRRVRLWLAASAIRDERPSLDVHPLWK